MIVRSTKNCPNTPRVLFALEELGIAYETDVVEDGHFTTTWISPGPSIHDGDVTTVEPGAIVRHLVRREKGRLWPTTLAEQADADRWIELQSRRMSRAVEAKDGAAIGRILGMTDAHLAKGPWFMGETLTAVDVMWSVLAIPQARAMLPLASFANLSAWCDRVLARPAYARALARVPR